jgi:hypothetical protein
LRRFALAEPSNGNAIACESGKFQAKFRPR